MKLGINSVVFYLFGLFSISISVDRPQSVAISKWRHFLRKGRLTPLTTVQLHEISVNVKPLYSQFMKYFTCVDARYVRWEIILFRSFYLNLVVSKGEIYIMYRILRNRRLFKLSCPLSLIT